jgi:predicted GTPase
MSASPRCSADSWARNLALVDDQPGVTRDRRFGEAHLLGLDFTIVDTAGWEDEDAHIARPHARPDRGQRSKAAMWRCSSSTRAQA